MYKKNEKNYLARTLRNLRVSAGYTQQNVADILNLNRSTYTYYETGKTMPDIHTLKTLSKILNVSINVFLEEENNSPFAADSGRRRPKKTVHENPQKIGELSSKEKALIALLRKNNHDDLDDVIEQLKEKSQK
jgi:Predicted transcriptional regulators